MWCDNRCDTVRRFTELSIELEVSIQIYMVKNDFQDRVRHSLFSMEGDMWYEFSKSKDIPAIVLSDLTGFEG